MDKKPSKPRKPRKPGPTTERQQQALDYYAAHWAKHKCSPTVRDVMRHLGCASTQGALRHIDALIKRGLLVPVVTQSGGHRGLIPAWKLEETA